MEWATGNTQKYEKFRQISARGAHHPPQERKYSHRVSSHGRLSSCVEANADTAQVADVKGPFLTVVYSFAR